jgi:phosphate transport system substrate-binding protein
MVSRMSAFPKKMIGWTAMMMIIIIMVAPFPGYPADSIRIGGSGAGLATVRLLAQAYEQGHPGVHIEILPSLGSSGGIKAVLQGAIDIAVSSRPLKQDETARGANNVEYARTPLVFVSPANTGKTDLTTAELEGIYSGEVQRWPDGSRLRLVMRPASESMTGDLRRISQKMDGAVTAALEREGMIVAVTDQDNAEILEKTRGSFGAITLTQVVAEGIKLQVFSYNGIIPSAGTLMDGSYPLSRSLFLVTGPEVKRPAQEFIQFIRSGPARNILRQNGNIAVNGGARR